MYGAADHDKEIQSKTHWKINIGVGLAVLSVVLLGTAGFALLATNASSHSIMVSAKNIDTNIDAILGVKGVDKCPPNYERITNPIECETKAKMLGFEYYNKLTDVDRSTSVCNVCHGCKENDGGPNTARVDATHAARARWICKYTEAIATLGEPIVAGGTTLKLIPPPQGIKAGDGIILAKGTSLEETNTVKSVVANRRRLSETKTVTVTLVNAVKFDHSAATTLAVETAKPTKPTAEPTAQPSTKPTSEPTDCYPVLVAANQQYNYFKSLGKATDILHCSRATQDEIGGGGIGGGLCGPEFMFGGPGGNSCYCAEKGKTSFSKREGWSRYAIPSACVPDYIITSTYPTKRPTRSPPVIIGGMMQFG